VLLESWADGDFNAPKFGESRISRMLYSNANWHGQPRGSLNPLQDYKARQLSELQAWTTGAQNAAELGTNRDENIKARRVEAQELMEINGE
jgi:hypothetical protein